MTAPKLTLRALGRATLARQMLLAREKTTAVHAVERLMGLQAQWPRPPFVGLWSRIEAFQPEDLAGSLQRRELVRASMMRGTLHVVSAGDFRSLRPAIQPVLTRGMTSILRDRATALDVPALVASARAFFEEEPRTFTELRDHLMTLHPAGDERAMGFAVRTHLPLVQVPTEATWAFPADSDFAVAESWLGAPLGDDASPEALILRYLAAFGPATVADAQAWSGLQGLRAVMETLRPKLIALRDERGREAFDLPDAPRPDEDTAAPVRFLPEFDNLIVSRADARFVADAHRSSIFLSALRVLPTLLVDGAAAATWKSERKKATATLVITPFAALPKKTRAAVEEEAGALLRFVESDARTFEIKINSPA
jgi:winged helix DNA-binding protein